MEGFSTEDKTWRLSRSDEEKVVTVRDDNGKAKETTEFVMTPNGGRQFFTSVSNISGNDFISKGRPTPKPRKIFYTDPNIERSAETTAITKISDLTIDRTLTNNHQLLEYSTN